MIGAVTEGRITKQELAGLLSENQAKLYNIYPRKGSVQIGSDADFTIVDFNKKMVIKEENLHSKSKVTAFDGFEILGKPFATIVRGHCVMRDGQVTSEINGELIKP